MQCNRNSVKNFTDCIDIVLAATKRNATNSPICRRRKRSDTKRKSLAELNAAALLRRGLESCLIEQRYRLQVILRLARNRTTVSARTMLPCDTAGLLVLRLIQCPITRSHWP